MLPALRRHAIRAVFPIASLLLILWTASPAAAHAELVDATPADGARLATVPAEAVLTFSEELDPDGSGFEVTAPDGGAAGSGTVDLEVADRNVLRGAITDRGPGSYTIAWTSVAADGHEEKGNLRFRVGEEALANTALRVSRPPAVVGWLLLALAGLFLVRRRAR